MRTFLQQIAALLGCLGLLYAACLGVALAIEPLAPRTSDAMSATDATIDTMQAPSSRFGTYHKYAFLNRVGLRAVKDRVVLIGSSNTMRGVRPAALQRLVPGTQVANLAVPSANIRELRQIVELVYEMQAPAARQRETFVIGIWYGTFVTDEVRWHNPDRHAGDTDIDVERYRYGFWRRTPHGPERVLPASQLALGVTLVHPLLLLERGVRLATARMRDALSGHAPELSDAQRDVIVPTDPQKQRMLRFHAEYMGGVPELSAEQFELLKSTVGYAHDNGSRVIIAILPIPRWHAHNSRYTHSFEARIDDLKSALSILPGVSLLDLQDLDDDDNFYDEVHPRPRCSSVWERRLAALIGSAGPTEPSNTLATPAPTAARDQVVVGAQASMVEL
jgi:hypothetical protein